MNRNNLGEKPKIKAFAPRRFSKIKETIKAERRKFSKSIEYKLQILSNRISESAYLSSVNRMWAEFKGEIVGGAVTAAVAVALCLAINALNWGLGYEVIVDGENIGLVTDRTVTFDAIDRVGERLADYFGEEQSYNKEPVFVRRIVDKDKLASKADLENALLANIDTMVEAYSVYIDGEQLFGVSSMDAAEWVFAKYKQKYIGEEITDDMVVDFCEDIQVRKEFVHIALLQTPETALEVLSDNDRELGVYTVQDDDTLWGIAEKYDTTVEHILAMNDDLTDSIKAGMELKIEEAVPKLSVRSEQTVSLTESVPYQVEKIKDDTLYEGRTVVSRKGQEGTARVLARVTKVNGVEVGKSVIESETVTAPVTQVEKIGTKERPPTTGSGTFIKPTYGTLTSRYGRRWNRSHKGIDIGGSYNSPIKAADGGVVTYAGWMSGYGNYVVINHENGYQTAYGHCASLNVSVGSRVAKGDVIAKMGNTGRSTGTHLHFEVKKNGEYVDPLKYVGY